MQSNRDLIEDIDLACSQGNSERRAAALWHATDVLLTGQFSDDRIWLFGEIIERLAADLEVRARARLAERLAPSSNAPTQVIHSLAQDDAIEVAGPVLTRSERIDGQMLVAIARTKGQSHLMAISKRRTVSAPVTDVLVTRGDQGVLRAIAKNEGAQFSASGFWRLVRRAENDSILAECVGQRKDIPRHLFLKLIAKASEGVRERLSVFVPQERELVEHTVAELTGAMQARMGPGSKEYYAAKRHLTELHRAGALGERELFAFAREHRFDETAITFALLCAVPIDLAERALIEDHPEMVIVIGKAGDLSWRAVVELLHVRAGRSGVAAQDLEAALAKFSRLTVSAARTVLKVHQTRRKSAAM